MAGTIYPSSRTRRWNSTYRVGFLLKEEVNPPRLRAALEDMQQRLPGFFAALRGGLFWYYLERMDSLDIIAPESAYPCRPMNMFSKSRPAMRVYYDRRRLSVELSHAIADGGGATIFATALLARYLQLGGAQVPQDCGIPMADEAPRAEDLADGYRENFTPSAGKYSEGPRAYQYRPPIIPGYLKMIHAAIPAEDLLPLAKAKGITLTDYLLGAYIYAFCHGDPKACRSRKPIRISVPVSLRKLYPTQTLRNFSLFTNIGFQPKGSAAAPGFDEILADIKGKLEAGKAKEEIHKLLCRHAGTIQNPFLRAIPNVLKRLGLRVGFVLAEEHQTSPMSNLGRFRLPPALAEHVDCFEVLMGGSPQMILNLAVVSDERFVHLFFTSASPKTDVQRAFLRLLTGEGARVRVESNVREVCA